MGGNICKGSKRYLKIRIFHQVVVVLESVKREIFDGFRAYVWLKRGNSRYPTALGSYPEYLQVPHRESNPLSQLSLTEAQKCIPSLNETLLKIKPPQGASQLDHRF